MAIDILMPPLSQTMDSLVLAEWSKRPGDPVRKGETLFVVETDKSTLEVESPGAGVLLEVLAQPGEEVKVGARIGVIEEAGLGSKSTSTKDDAPGKRILASPRARGLAQREGIALTEATPTGPQGMIVERDVRAALERRAAQPRATPLAQRVAEAAGIDLAAVTPAAPGAPITRADVEAAARQAPAAAPEPAGTRQPLTPMRKTIARRMQDSHQHTAPVTLHREVDATELVALRERILKDLGPADPRPTYTDLLVSIVARCLARHPQLNATFDGEALELGGQVDMGLAMDTERGLVAPVLRSALGKGLLDLARERARLAERAAAGQLGPEELSGGTFTLTNLGALGVDSFTPLINPPQVAILGVGRIRAVPAVHDNQVAIRQAMALSLTFDHRVVDGAPAARLLNDIALLIENPHRVWL